MCVVAVESEDGQYEERARYTFVDLVFVKLSLLNSCSCVCLAQYNFSL